MPRYKVLKSVAHNLGHWYMSSMHYLDNDHVSEHLRRTAEATGIAHVRVDAVTGSMEPASFTTPVLTRSAKNAQETLKHLVTTGGASMTQVQQAEIVVDFELWSEQLHYRMPGVKLRPYHCVGRIVDDRGKEYVADVEEWWKY